MNNIFKFIIAIGLLVVATSCEKFLEEVSQDQIVPKTVYDYSELLLGEGYIRNSQSIHTYLELMTDDVKSHYARPSLLSSDTRDTGFGYFTWQPQPELTMGGPIANDKSWQTYYKSIVIANIVIAQVDDASGSTEEKDRLKAEAHMIRAYSYFMLVNLFGKPYNAESAGSDLGVPINTMTYMEDVKLGRKSVEENYNYIISEIDSAIDLFKNVSGKKGIFRWNYISAQLMASRVHLYMRNYEKAELHASQVLAQSPTLYDLNIKAANSTTLGQYFLNSNNPEILFSYGDYFISYFSPGANGCFPASESLKSAFASNDLRYSTSKGAFVRQQGNFFGRQITNFKNGDESVTQVYGFALRTAEAYLNRAEAYVMQGKIELALKDINQLRMSRINSSSYAELAANNQAEATEIVRNERRLELCYEQHRWFDLRRWDQPRIVHEFVEEYNPYTTKTYVLELNDDAYTLPIPISVINYQPDMQNNNRPERQ